MNETGGRSCNRRIGPKSDAGIIVWGAGYLFTIGAANVSGWGLLYALLFWPIYLGYAVRYFITGQL